MQCREVRDLADSFLSEQLLVETNHELLRHLDACPACRAEITSREMLRYSIKTSFTRSESLRMREEFRSSILAQLGATARSTAFRRFAAAWRQIIAAAVLLAAVGLGVFLLSGRATAAERDAAGDHHDCALLMHLSEKPISLADAARYDPAFQDLQDTPLDEVTAPAGTIRVLRRHSCTFNGRRFAHVILQFQGQVVSLLVTDDDNHASEPTNGAGSQPRFEWLPAVDGFNVVSFTAPGHRVFLVGSLPKPALQQVADSLAGPVYRRLLGE